MVAFVVFIASVSEGNLSVTGSCRGSHSDINRNRDGGACAWPQSSVALECVSVLPCSIANTAVAYLSLANNVWRLQRSLEAIHNVYESLQILNNAVRCPHLLSQILASPSFPCGGSSLLEQANKKSKQTISINQLDGER